MAPQNDNSRSRKPASGQRSSRPAGGSKPASRDSRGGSKPGSRDSRGGSKPGSRDSRDSRDSRGGSKPGSRDSRDSRGGSRDSRDSRGPGGPGGRSRRDDRDEAPRKPPPKNWGSVARKGAQKIGEVPFEEEQSFTPEEKRKFEQRVARRAAESDRRDQLRGEAREAVARAGELPGKKTRKKAAIERRPLPGRTPMPVDTKVSFAKALGDRDGQKANRKLGQAASAFEAGRFDDARKLLKPLADIAPDIPEVQELYGLTLYRLERWQQGADRLEEFRALAGSPEQNPVLADCYRALGRWSEADFFWAELREYSPSSELVTEGRIVAAGVLADQGKESDAIRLLEQKWTRPKRPKDHHLSRAYALADLYERAGDEPRARELFGWIDSHAPGFSDAGDRSG